MYGPDLDHIESRLAFLRALCGRAERVLAAERGGADPAVVRLAAERIVHVAAEGVTDVGSHLLDRIIMRDASSYEDIVDILHQEGMFADDLHAFLRELALMRKPLVQQYDRVDGDKLARLAGELAGKLPAFIEAVRRFVAKETGLADPAGRRSE
jgi:uncharacterized protein YutE (UPF0331/DUF86 family)